MTLDQLMDALRELVARIPGAASATVTVVVEKRYFDDEEDASSPRTVCVIADEVDRIDYEHGAVTLSGER